MANVALAQSTSSIPVDPATGKTLWWCEVRGGMYMCLPRFLEVAGWFKGVQRAVNAYRAKKGQPPIRVDARIGPETTAALNEVMRELYSAPINYTTDQIAANAVQLATDINNAAGAGAPDLAPDPKPRPEEEPTLVPPETTAMANKDKSNLKWWLLGAAVLAAGFGGWYLYRRNKGKPVFSFAGVDEDDDEDSYPELGNVIDV